MSAADNSQTDPVPRDENADVCVDVRINMRIDVHIHVHDDPQDPSDGPNSDQSQQSNQNTGREDNQADTGADGQEDRAPAESSEFAPIVLTELASHPPRWPADGFADDDPAAAHMVDILQSADMQAVTPSAIEDIIIVRNTNNEERKHRPFENLSRRRMQDGSDCNFFLPDPGCLKIMIGKVDGSKIGLTVIIQALQAAVRKHEKNISFPPLRHHVNRLNAANGAMTYNRHPGNFQNNQAYTSWVDPFTPEGARTAVATVQAAARDHTCDYFIFLAAPPTIGRAPGQSFALLVVYPVI